MSHTRPSPKGAAADCAGCPVMSRREFVGRASMVLAALGLAGCGIGSSLEPLRSSVTINLADHPALLTVGGAAAVSTDPKTPVAVSRLSETEFEAFSLKCPHEGQQVGVYNDSKTFVCSGHGARFNLQGQWIGGQSTGNLTSYRTTFDAAAGTVTISP